VDTAVAVAVISLIGVIVTAAATVAVASLTNRSEKKGTAGSAIELTLQQRLEVRDERIKLRDEQLEDCEKEKEDLGSEVTRLRQYIEELRSEVSTIVEGREAE